MSTILYYADFQHFGYCENWIADALDRNGHHCLRIQRRSVYREEPLIAIANQYSADYLLISKSPDVQAVSLRRIRNHTQMKIIMWTFDWMQHPENWKWFEPMAKESDVVFCTDGSDADGFYQKNGIPRVELHQGCVPGLHDLPYGATAGHPLSFGLSVYGVDLAFIGSGYSQRRIQLFSELARYPGFQKWGEPGPQLWGREFSAAAHLSKIVIGDNFVNDVPGYWSDRVYLTLGCGGFFLTAYVPGLEKEFENHRHLVWWTDFKDLHKQIEYYLPRENERRAIALEGFRRVHIEHTYDRRIQVMSDHLNKL